MNQLTDFVKRCQQTMAEYERLRTLGICHEIALVQSGFRDAVMGRSIDQRKLLVDTRAAASGEREE